MHASFVCNNPFFNIIIAPMQNVRHMPIGIQDFEVIREPFYVYVDKIGFIPRLEVLGRAYLYLHYKLILKVRKELFKGLAIEKYK